MDILGDRWTLLIALEILLGNHRFGQIQRRLGLAPTVLSSRLALLTERRLVRRRRYHRDPDWFEYHLTARGLALRPVIVEMVRWGEQYDRGELPSRRVTPTSVKSTA